MNRDLRDRIETAIAYAFESCGEAWMDDTSGDRLAYSAAEAVEDLLAEVSDYKVLKALNAYERVKHNQLRLSNTPYTESDSLEDWSMGDVSRMRAALEAVL